MIEPAASGMIRVEVVYAVPDRYWRKRLQLPAGASVAEAVQAAAMAELVGVPALELAGMAVFSRPVQPGTILRDGDRLELLRELSVDPKQGRRARASGAGPASR